MWCISHLEPRKILVLEEIKHKIANILSIKCKEANNVTVIMATHMRLELARNSIALATKMYYVIPELGKRISQVRLA